MPTQGFKKLKILISRQPDCDTGQYVQLESGEGEPWTYIEAIATKVTVTIEKGCDVVVLQK